VAKTNIKAIDAFSAVTDDVFIDTFLAVKTGYPACWSLSLACG
jgi:hypothetical protein